jgi:hypothetical protein
MVGCMKGHTWRVGCCGAGPKVAAVWQSCLCSSRPQVALRIQSHEIKGELQQGKRCHQGAAGAGAPGGLEGGSAPRRLKKDEGHVHLNGAPSQASHSCRSPFLTDCQA